MSGPSNVLLLVNDHAAGSDSDTVDLVAATPACTTRSDGSGSGELADVDLGLVPLAPVTTSPARSAE